MSVSSLRIYGEFSKGIWKENPVFVHVLGLCPMLAVTNSAINALAMAIATGFVLLGSWVIMLLPPGGFLTLGLILLFFNWLQEQRPQPQTTFPTNSHLEGEKT